MATKVLKPGKLMRYGLVLCKYIRPWKCGTAYHNAKYRERAETLRNDHYDIRAQEPCRADLLPMYIDDEEEYLL